MKTSALLVSATLACLALAGCVGNEDESTAEGRARGFSVSVPEEAERLRVEVSARSQEDATVAIEVEREDRSDLAKDTIELSRGNASRTLEADVSGMHTAWILAIVTDGDATLSFRVFAIAADGTEIFLRAEKYDV